MGLRWHDGSVIKEAVLVSWKADSPGVKAKHQAMG